MTSVAYSALCRSFDQYRSAGRSLVLCEVGAKMQHIFVITKLALVFDIYPDALSAIASFSAAK